MPDRSSSGLPNCRHELLRELFCVGLLAAAFVLFAALSWRTWPDVLVDFGQEVYVPWRLAEGDVLYRDIAWVTGPLPQYANSLLFRIFGVSLTTLIAANLVILAAIVGMFYYLFRQCGTRWSATWACLFFLAVSAFGQYSVIGNYNYICPYRHDITHGLAIGLINVLCLVRFGQSRHGIWLAAAGLCLGLLFLGKIEMTLAACLTTAAALALFAWPREPVTHNADGVTPGTLISKLLIAIRQLARWSVIVVAAALVPMTIAVAALAAPLGWSNSFNQIFLQYRLVFSPELSAGSGFYRAIMGSDLAGENFLTMALTTIVALAMVIGGYVLEMIFGGSKYTRIWAGVLGIAIAGFGQALIPLAEWQILPACIPVLLVPIVLVTLRRVLRDAREADTILFLAAIFSMGLLPKILLRVSWVHYGFVLAVPATFVLIHVALYSIPAYCDGHRRTGTCFRAVMTGLLVACAMPHAGSWIRIDQGKTVAVGNQGDLFYGEPRYDSRTLSTVNTLAYLQAQMRPDDTLIVFPNGVILNYLLRKRNPTPYIMFNPWESEVHGGENLIADTVISAAPDYAVIVSMDLTIHGRGNFGSPDFGGRIRKFLDEHYDIVNVEIARGGLEREFTAAVFKRRSKPQ